MIDNEFFDTNIILYAKIDDATCKHYIAKELVEQKILYGEPYISVQVINEFTVNVLRKGKKLPEIQRIVEKLLAVFHILPLTAKITMDSFRISNRYQFSFWDSLIISTALEARCSILYTEDLKDGQIIDDVLEIRNPFINRTKII